MDCRSRLFAALGATLFFHSSAGIAEGNFESQCDSEKDYGWPRFQSLADLQASPWASYFASVYGELPSNYPVCIYDMWDLDEDAYFKANISDHTPVPLNKSHPLQEGDLFESGQGYQIYHGSWKPLADNTWVEITHTAFPTELKGFWVWRTRGSGIWYNVGRTKVFPTPADPKLTHAEAIKFLRANCSVTPSTHWPLQESDIFGLCAREKGYDSIQFEPQQGQTPLGTFGLTGLTEIVLVNIDGHDSCGVADARKTPLRDGWMASKQCECANVEIADSCGLMPRAPFPLSIFGASPLCKLQEGPFWNKWFHACDPATCRKTACGQHKLAGKRIAKPAGDEVIDAHYVTV